MVIFELLKPGHQLELLDNREKNFKLERLVDHLINTFFESNIALNLYLQEKERKSNDLKNIEVDWEKDRAITEEIRKNIEKQYNQDEVFTKFNEIHSKTQKELKIEKWKNGEIPKDFNNKIIFIYAKTFLFSLDNFEKQFDKLLAEEGVPHNAKILYKKFKDSFPKLRDLRNSAHHFEDRIRGMAHSKKIDLKPIDNSAIYAPNGGILVLNSLNNDNYGGVLADGTLGEVEVSVSSVSKLQEILQEFLYLLPWTGDCEHLPR
jgi:hypothetical protein